MNSITQKPRCEKHLFHIFCVKRKGNKTTRKPQAINQHVKVCYVLAQIKINENLLHEARAHIACGLLPVTSYQLLLGHAEKGNRNNWVTEMRWKDNIFKLGKSGFFCSTTDLYSSISLRMTYA